jgi:hypothetical protein
MSTYWNSVAHLFAKMSATGETCRRSFDAIASPRPVVFPTPEKLYFSSCDSAVLGVRYTNRWFTVAK